MYTYAPDARLVSELKCNQGIKNVAPGSLHRHRSMWQWIFWHYIIHLFLSRKREVQCGCGSARNCSRWRGSCQDMLEYLNHLKTCSSILSAVVDNSEKQSKRTQRRKMPSTSPSMQQLLKFIIVGDSGLLVDCLKSSVMAPPMCACDDFRLLLKLWMWFVLHECVTSVWSVSLLSAPLSWINALNASSMRSRIS